jgi:hypothetical protein
VQIEPTATQDGMAVNRRSVLTGAAPFGTVFALAALWHQTQRLANAQGDLRIDLLNLGLQSEYLMCSAYQEAVEHGDILSAQDLKFVQAMLFECTASVEQLRGAIEELGGRPIAPTGMTYPEEAKHDRGTCLQLLLELESITIQGWQGAVPMATDPRVVTLTQPMGFTKARRAGALAFLLGDAATPSSSAIEPGLPLSDVLDKLEPYRGAPE